MTVKKVIKGRMTHTRVRREKGPEYKVMIDVGVFEEKLKEVTRRKPGRIFVEVLVWEGPEATGEPLAEWELPHALRYDLDEAARLAVAQTRFPEAQAEPLPEGSWHPDDPAADHTEVTFVMIYKRRGDGRRIRLSGRDYAGKIRAVDRAIHNHVDQPVWLHVHRADHGVREPWSATMSMLFTTPAIESIAIEEVDTVIEEEL